MTSDVIIVMHQGEAKQRKLKREQKQKQQGGAKNDDANTTATADGDITIIHDGGGVNLTYQGY